MIVVGRHDFGQVVGDTATRAPDPLSVPSRAARFPSGLGVYVGGAAAQGADFLTRVYGAFP